ncbi:MAG TPA: FHA domain-containing protein [Candidatus Bathyarchaeia archaeon]|nr:FHA domain-containing protein [Candidatus Bathyarchaeia archaeon]
MRYVKICPRCGKQNDELSDSCAADGEFLGMVPATPEPDSPPDTPSQHPGEIPFIKRHGKRYAPGGPTAAVNTRVDQQRRKESAQDEPEPEPEMCEPQPEPAATPEPMPTLFLETGTASGQVFEVREAYVVGQAHPSSTAQIQLADLPGVAYVHRSHCSFAFKDRKWHVTPIEQQTYTNPTLVNQQRVPPGESCPLRNGDRLTLSGLTLTVRIIEF